MARPKFFASAGRSAIWLPLCAGLLLLFLPNSAARQTETLSVIDRGWRWGYVDSAGNSGEFGDIVLDAAGFPHISYYARTQGDLKVGFQDASGWHVEVVDSAGNVGQYTSIDLDSAGFQHISTYDATNADLKLATQDATGWHIAVIDSTGDVGQVSSLAVDSAGAVHIAYYDATNADLKLATQDQTGWHIAVVDSAGDVGRQVSLSLDSRDRPVLAYYDSTNAAVKLARWDGNAWQFEVVETVTRAPLPSLAINPQDEPLVAYCSNDGVHVAHRTASGWTFETIAQPYVHSLALALNRQGEPRLYYGAQQAVYAYRDQAGWQLTAAPVAFWSLFPGLAIDAEDDPHLIVDGMSPDYTSGALVYATAPSDLADGSWVTQRAGTPDATFRFVDADHGWAASTALDGAIYWTSDGGIAWQQTRLGSYWDRYQVVDIVFLNNQEGWATGRRDYYDVWPYRLFIVHTLDGGRTWTQQANLPGLLAQGMWFVDAQNGWVAAWPSLLQTRDGGATWAELRPNTMPDRMLRFTNATTGFGLDTRETPPILVRTNDAGESWSPVAAVPEWHQAIWVADDGLALWAVGDAGQIARSVDGGVTWSGVASPTTADLTAVAFAGAQHGWATGIGGALVLTTDGGLTWRLVDAGTGADITHLALAGWDHVWIYAGRLRQSEDAGAHWQALPYTSNKPIQSVRMGSATTGLAGENGGKLLKTYHGNLWVEQGDTSYGFVTVEAVDDQHVWILYGNSLHRTADGGQTWEVVDLHRYGAMDVDFVDPNRGWLVIGEQVQATVDGGRTWTPQVAPNATYLDVDFVDAQHGWIMARAGQQRVWLKTDDGGLTWAQVGETTEARVSGPMEFSDLTHGWAIDHGSSSDYTPLVVMRTVDGGVHWQPASSAGRYTGIDFANALEGWAVGADGAILYTRDGGVTWSGKQHELATSFRDVHAAAPGVAWLVGDNGLIVRYSVEPPLGCWATPAPHPTLAGTPPSHGTIDQRVVYCMDDAYERVDTQTLLVDEAFVRAGAREGGQAPYQDGLLFRDVWLPQGARITSARLLLEPWGWQSGVPVEVDIRGERSLNAADFNPANQRLDERPRTSAHVRWLLDTLAASTVESPDIAGIVEEIVGQPGWHAGNSLALTLDAVTESVQYVDWKAYDTNPALAARLVVSYETGPTATATATRTPTANPTPTSAPAWTIETVDSDGQVGHGSSIALAADGSPAISYFDRTNNALKFAQRLADEWRFEIAAPDSYGGSSLALDASGYPHIGYATAGSVRYAFKDGTGWHIETVFSISDDSLPDETYWFRSVELALDESMAPHMTYVLNASHMSWYGSSVVYARRDTSGWHRTEISYDGCEQCSAGSDAALAIDADDRPHVIYTKLHDGSYTVKDLWYVYWDGNGWQREVLAYVGFPGSQDLALRLGSEGSPHVGFMQGPEPHVEYGFRDASGWHFETVFPGDQWVGEGVDLALDASGGASMSFPIYDQAHHGTALMFAERQDAGWQGETVVENHVGAISLALDDQGLPFISYFDTLDYDLKLAMRRPSLPPTATPTPSPTQSGTPTRTPSATNTPTATGTPERFGAYLPLIIRREPPGQHGIYLPLITRE